MEQALGSREQDVMTRAKRKEDLPPSLLCSAPPGPLPVGEEEGNGFCLSSGDSVGSRTQAT